MFRIVLFFLVLFFSVELSFAQQNTQDVNSLKEKLIKINEEIEFNRKSKEDLQNELKTLAKEVQDSKSFIDSSESEVASLELQIKKINEEKSLVKSYYDEQLSRLEEEKLVINKRILAFYKTRKSASFLDYLLNSNNASDLNKRSTYLRYILEKDQLKYAKYLALIDGTEKHKIKLDNLIKESEQAISEIELKKSQIREKEQKFKELQITSKNRERNLDLSLQKLKRSQEELESLVANFTKFGKASSEISSDLKVSIPVKGEIIKKFGDESSGFQFGKGILFSVSPQTSINPVKSGIVAMIQDMAGYGSVIIIDHGNRVFSLYAGIDSISVKENQSVDQRTEIAKVNSQAKLYLELRINGKAQDPQIYLK